jgi:BASS family bile acid:Na+ symporter
MRNLQKSGRRFLLGIFFISAVITVALWISDRTEHIGPAVVVLFASLALYVTFQRVLKSFSFTAWVFAFVAASLVYPVAFGTWFGFDLKALIVPLIQIIMFGMGTTLSSRDFLRVFKMPWPVLIGFVLQFSVMPIAGYLIAKAFGFEAEIAAGVILIGSCPGGVASNLMAYLSGGNVALSVTMTSCSTLVSPLMTPFLMKKLAGKLISVDFVAMMLSILNMIIVPILAGLVANRILYGKGKSVNSAASLFLIGAGSVAVAVAAGFVPGEVLGTMAAVKSGVIIGFTLIGIVAFAKMVVRVMLNGPEHWIDKALPFISMAGICYIIAIITARSREELLAVATALIAAAMIHNAIGYFLGYWASRAVRLDERTSRTIAFEVGMQNGGMASALAMNVLGSVNAALAPAIFGPWMNISGSVLATWWHRKPPKDGSKGEE